MDLILYEWVDLAFEKSYAEIICQLNEKACFNDPVIAFVVSVTQEVAQPDGA